LGQGLGTGRGRGEQQGEDGGEPHGGRAYICSVAKCHEIEISSMPGRPRVHPDRVMTSTERQRRSRARQLGRIKPQAVIDDVRLKLHRCGFAPEGKQIVEGLAALIAEWRHQQRREQFIAPKRRKG
jgi:hypothetical protein